MAIDLNKLKQLREETGLSVSLCRKALEETDYDIEKAKKKLNEWTGEKISEKLSRTASQGGIFCYMHHNRKIAGMVELRSETDFVSGNEEFRKLGTELAMQIATFPSETVEEFLKQEYIRDAKQTIDELIKAAILKFGENIQVARIVRWELGQN